MHPPAPSPLAVAPRYIRQLLLGGLLLLALGRLLGRALLPLGLGRRRIVIVLILVLVLLTLLALKAAKRNGRRRLIASRRLVEDMRGLKTAHPGCDLSP